MSDERFRGAFRVGSARLEGWDYRKPGAYFVTICTGGRRCTLGEVRDEPDGGATVVVSRAGAIVAEEWLRTEALRPYVRLDGWIVMPNHFHGILALTEPAARTAAPVETPRRGVSTMGMSKRPPHRLEAGSLGAIVGQFKSVSTKRIRATCNPAFAWQPRFHDHVIRNDRELDYIRRYIAENPAQWQQDRYYAADAA
ncbi:MAG TPA: hypothetical protein VFQ45_14735 [Longimicrobium sp.]|nr:hypothetical protein [Longimicrobium sp.]